MKQRPRRLRKNPIIREMIAETRLSKDMFIYPYFIVPGKKENIRLMQCRALIIFRWMNY